MNRTLKAAISTVLVVLAAGPALAADKPHNLIIFVADGLRSAIVSPGTAPALAAVRDEGVDFRNSHSLYPTFTTANASAIATGHHLGDTGDFANSIDVGTPFDPPVATRFADLEDDGVLGLMNQRFGGNYLNRKSLLQAAREHGFNTAALGKLGPVAIQDVTARDGKGSIIIDDATGSPDGVALAPDIAAAIKAAGLPVKAPDRGLNGGSPQFNMPGVLVANVEQQDWFKAVATQVLLPRFKADGKPFVLIFWSRDPDGTQHGQGDSQDTLSPGINGPTSLKAIRNASDDLQALRDAVAALGLADTTDVIATADHGFSTNAHDSATSFAARQSYPDVRPGALPQGFLAIDLAHALGQDLFDAFGTRVDVAAGFHPKGGAVIGQSAQDPQLVVAANGGSDLIYLGAHADPVLARRVVEILAGQDYTGALFVDDALGPIPGALPLSAIGLVGSAATPRPAIVISFRSFSTGCADPELCGAETADTGLQQGQGMHGTLGRADTHNFMAAIGPDFLKGFRDPTPVSNADIAPTAARVLGLDLGAGGQVPGRVASEALAADGRPVASAAHVLKSEPAANGFTTILDYQDAAGVPYLDEAGAPGRAVGLKE